MQNYYYNLCKHSGHEVTVLAPKYDGDEPFDADQPFNIIRGPFMKNERVHVASWPDFSPMYAVPFDRRKSKSQFTGIS